ncbi:uncharacterized protein LOC126418994 [Schistocerca serialis cubense]|uniref:uncharacterized protein LOC126418994 n=1 Tax=Schistocerca serialis cubense TaxID=2023355 RepID=UPI00214E5023|nr:uncharacterized protein LOC126418994 [Schistocerca serialis cubense]
MVTVLAAEPDKEDDDGATVAVPKCRRDSPDLDECLQRALQASLPLLLRAEVESKNVLHGVKSMKEGRQYVDVHLDGDILSVAGLSVRFHGLFTGDKDKEEQANRLLNEHWQQLWSALEPALDAAYNRLLSEISGKALAQLPLAAILDDP